MHCPACSRVLRDDARFCDACGTPLAASPPAPQAPTSSADRILGARAAPEGERKQVTVLFADVQGSLELAEQLDPEEWSRVMGRFVRILSDGVERYGGFVDKFTGDGIMALFGAPIAHENHAQRACWAALRLRGEIADYATRVKREHGLGFSVRIGINSGDVVVGRIGDDLRMDYTAQGHTVGLAQRMEALASPDTCWLTDATAALVRGYFELEDLGEFRVKGVSAPVRVHRLVGLGTARTRFDVARARGLTRFVGRDADMATLEAALEQARVGDGQVVGVVAEAGTGKSRLCFEFLERCRARGLRVLEGTCVAHGRDLPFLPILQVIRAYYGIAEDDDDRTAREKIAGRMLLLDESYREVLPLLFEFLGVADPERPAPPLPPEARQRRLFAALRRLMHGGPQPGQDAGIVLIEDLHWIDASSQAWIDEWVDATANAQSLLVVNFRPEYRAGWMQRTHYREIALAPLSAEALRELLADLIGHDPSTAGLAARIHAHTAGNPFFAEEVVQSLVESGALAGSRGAYRLTTPVERLRVPASVQAILAARIDRLAGRDKHVLQVAAVIGGDFAEPLLRAVADLPEGELADALAALRAGEFVHERALFPVAEYAFKHPLTQAVALGSLLRDRQRELHARVARALEASAPNLDEAAALLAHHWEEAAEPVTAARWHLRAADWIGPRDVNETARHARTVIEQLREREDAEGATALLGRASARLVSLGWRVGMKGDAARLYEEGRRWARAAGDLDAEARLVGGYAGGVCVAGRLAESLAIGQEFPVLAERLGDRDLEFVAAAWLAYPYMRMGHLADAERRMVRAIAEGERRPDLGVRFLGASLTGLLLQWLLELHATTRPWPDVQATFERALRWIRDRREVESECLLHGTWAEVLLDCAGLPERALVAARHALAHAEELGTVLPIAASKRTLAACLNATGEHAAALALCGEAIELARERCTSLEMESAYLETLSAARLGTGDVDGALADAQDAVATAERVGCLMALPAALAALARALLAARAHADAAATLDRMEEQARAMGAANLLPLVTWRRAELAHARGDETERRHLLAAAQRAFAARGADGHAAAIARELAASPDDG